MMPANLIYSPQFYQDLQDIIAYIALELENPDAADRFLVSLESAIIKRPEYPAAFEKRVIPDSDEPYYRIYVGNYTAWYVVRPDEVMEVRRLLFSGVKKNIKMPAYKYQNVFIRRVSFALPIIQQALIISLTLHEIQTFVLPVQAFPHIPVCLKGHTGPAAG
ncbi:MAG: type II toxin-antitoxin system RelE/ParE family toxin, partial [Eubacterium sp.]